MEKGGKEWVGEGGISVSTPISVLPPLLCSPPIIPAKPGSGLSDDSRRKSWPSLRMEMDIHLTRVIYALDSCLLQSDKALSHRGKAGQ